MSLKKTTLHVAGLADEVTPQSLSAAFLPFGDLVDVSIPVDEKTKKHRGFGFVEFDEREDALAALDNMHGAELLGKSLKVKVAKANVLTSNRAIWDETVWAEQQHQRSMAEILEKEGVTN